MRLEWADEAAKDDGYAIAESAFAIPLIVLATTVAMSLVLIAVSTLGLQATVHSAARDIARGVPPQEVRSSIATAHPDATVTVAPTPQGVTVTVRRDVRPWGFLLSGVTIPVQREVQVPWEVGASW